MSRSSSTDETPKKNQQTKYVAKDPPRKKSQINEDYYSREIEKAKEKYCKHSVMAKANIPPGAGAYDLSCPEGQQAFSKSIVDLCSQGIVEQIVKAMHQQPVNVTFPYMVTNDQQNQYMEPMSIDDAGPMQTDQPLQVINTSAAEANISQNSSIEFIKEVNRDKNKEPCNRT